MLQFLSIRGFAIIEELALPFHPGLTVLTGETGAGKSIIVDALQAVLGDRADPGMVREGESLARVEASFETVERVLPEGVDEASGEVVISREVRREGRGRAVVNSSMITLAQLKELGEGLVDLHGQHEHQSLLKTALHLRALDVFASLSARREALGECYRELVDTRRTIQAVDQGQKERLARQDYLRYVVAELDGAALVQGEEEALREEERILGASEKLLQTASLALEEIHQGEGSAAEKVRGAAVALAQMTGTDSRLGEILELVRGAETQLGEAGHLLMDYSGKIQTDPRRLEEIQERLAFIGNLKKKYGPSLGDVLRTLEEGKKELDLLEEGASDAEVLRTREKELAVRAEGLARELSSQRKRAASTFQERVQEELRDLAMEKVRFSVSFQEGALTEKGVDVVEFLISPNPGEPLMPLRKIASGGELSRVMLALKRILAGGDAVGTLVFDEVDAGIGGRVAAVLGRKLKDIARHHQVLCVTHLAPVAAFADHHIAVEKFEKQGRTVVAAHYLDEEQRVEELARMMGGIQLTPGIVESARELLLEARG